VLIDREKNKEMDEGLKEGCEKMESRSKRNRAEASKKG
jgi:hypothetical protein